MKFETINGKPYVILFVNRIVVGIEIELNPEKFCLVGFNGMVCYRENDFNWIEDTDFPHSEKPLTKEDYKIAMQILGYVKNESNTHTIGE